MITAIEIENFKCFRERQRIELGPISLLFGANNAGKSSVMQALMLFEYLFQDSDGRFESSEKIGGSVTLGDYEHFVHNHEMSNDISIRVELHQRNFQMVADENWWLELCISDSTASFPNEFTIHRSFIRQQSGSTLQLKGLRIGCGNRTVLCVSKQNDATDSKPSVPFQIKFDFGDMLIGLKSPILNKVSIDCDLAGGILKGLISSPFAETHLTKLLFKQADREGFVRLLNEFTIVVLKPFADFFGTVRYVGALRTLPSMNFVPKPINRVPPSAWYDGEAAWHWLAYAGEDNLIWTNQWLGPDYLDSGVEFVQQVLIDRDAIGDAINNITSLEEREAGIDRATFTKAMRIASQFEERRLRVRPLQGKRIAERNTPLLWPHDVGVGVSQLVPIVVACMSRCGRTFCIQEPETHVHPRLQARIGDLLIDSATKLPYGTPNQLIVETHSEHLILRLQRRIRETTAGNAPQNLTLDSDDVAVNYIGIADGVSYSRRIDIDQHGDFVQPWPDDFFDLDFKERFV